MKPLYLACLVGLLFVFPHVFAFIYHYPNYTHFVIANVSNAVNDESVFYAPRVHEFAETFSVITDVSLAEYKGHFPAPNFDMVAPAVLGTMYYFLGNMNLVYLLTTFFLPLLYFLLFFSFLKRITQNDALAICASVVIIFWSELVGYIPPVTMSMTTELLNFFTRIEGNVPITPFVRFYSMLFTYIIFFCAFYLTYLSLYEEKKKKICALIGGIFGGLLFYTYIYYWPINLGAIFFLTVGYVLRRDKEKVGLLLLNMGILVIIATPYLINLAYASSLPIAVEFLERGNADFTRFPRAALFFGVKFFLFYLLFYFMLKKTKTFTFLSSYYLTGTFFLFTPLILGKSIQLDHVAWKFMNQLFIFFLAYACSQWAKHHIHRLNKWAMAVTFLVFIHVAYAQTMFTAATLPHFTLHHSERELYSFIDRTIAPNETVLSLSVQTNSLLQIYTKANVYLPFALLTLAPEKELWQRILTAFAFYNIKPEKLSSIMDTKDAYFTYKKKLAEGKTFDVISIEKAYFFFYHFHRRYFWKKSHLPSSYDDRITPEAVAQGVEALPAKIHEEKIEEYQRTQSTALLTVSYQANYVLIGPYEHLLGAKITPDNLTKIFENELYDLYRINK